MARKTAINLRQLRVFIAIAEAGNFTRAAERLLLSQASLRAVYATEPVVRTEGAKTTPENAPGETDRADFLVSLDRLEPSGKRHGETGLIVFETVSLGRNIPPCVTFLQIDRLGLYLAKLE